MNNLSSSQIKRGVLIIGSLVVWHLVARFMVYGAELRALDTRNSYIIGGAGDGSGIVATAHIPASVMTHLPVTYFDTQASIGTWMAAHVAIFIFAGIIGWIVYGVYWLLTFIDRVMQSTAGDTSPQKTTSQPPSVDCVSQAVIH